jgi:hypothetical protein
LPLLTLVLRPAPPPEVLEFRIFHVLFLSQALSLAIRPPEREIETLNDRGLELAVADLVKNYLFSPAGYHR